MTRTRRTVEISDALWDALELMSREMSVDRDALVNQALFTFARFNGYVTPGSVAPHANASATAPAATAVPPVVQPLASPPSAVRQAQEPAPELQPPPAPLPSEPEAPRTATGSVAAVTRTGEPLATSPVPSTDPEGTPAPTAPEPAVDARHTVDGARDAAPANEPAAPGPDDEAPEDDGLEALPESGAVEWRPPRGVLADAAVALVTGEVKSRDFSGAVTLHDAAGKTLRTLELGPEPEDERVEAVLAHETHPPKHWKMVRDELVAEGRFAEGLLAAARAVGAGEPVATLTEFLAAHTLQRTKASGAQRAEKASFVMSNMNRFGAPPPRKAAYLVDELRQGASPATILRELAIDQDQYASSRAAADLIRCCKALEPANKGYFAYTQALIEMSLGNVDAARVAADELRERSEEQADFLSAYLNGLFPVFDFWPGQDAITSIELEVEAKAPVRTLADFRNAIQKAALRVRSLRALLTNLVPDDTTWLPPPVDAVLARSKVTLAEAEEVEVEEWQTKSIPQLMRKLRNEWARLTWLCWLAGLEQVASPTATSKPRSPSVVRLAMGMREHLFTLRGQEQAIEDGFEEADLENARLVATLPWNGTTLDELHPANASELALPEAQTVSEVLAWAADPEVASPFFGADASDDEDSEEAEDDEAPAGDDDEADAEQPADDADDAEADAPSDEQAREAPADEADERPTTGETAAPAPSPEDSEPPHVPENADRTAIVRPSGRKIWIQREGHDTVELAGMRFTVGRDPRCEIVIASPRVSREHAAILVDEETVLVTDLGSSNGTFFDGERITKHLVKDGDTVQFGNEKVTFRFTDPG
jgi:hypothetical protein